MLAAGLFALTPRSNEAQVSTTRGLSLGVQLLGTAIAEAGKDGSEGGGIGFRAGYGFNRIVTGFVTIDGSEIDLPPGSSLAGAWTLGHAEVGARFHFANSLRRWVPYLETSVGARVVSVDDASAGSQQVGKVSFNGGAFTVGGGLNAFFRRNLALDVSLRVTNGEFTEVDLGSVALQNLDIEATSVRFGVGLTWWPK